MVHKHGGKRCHGDATDRGTTRSSPALAPFDRGRAGYRSACAVLNGKTMKKLLGSLFVIAGACASDTGGDSCACEITNNGVSTTLACGTSDCVNGRSYMCGIDADITSGGSCTTGGGTGSQNGTPGMGTFDCNGDSCDAATQYCIISQIGSVTASSVCAPLPQDCSTCGCLGDVEQAWKDLNDGTSNCTSATELCVTSNNTVTVTCMKASL